MEFYAFVRDPYLRLPVLTSRVPIGNGRGSVCSSSRHQSCASYAERIESRPDRPPLSQKYRLRGALPKGDRSDSVRGWRRLDRRPVHLYLLQLVGLV